MAIKAKNLKDAEALQHSGISKVELDDFFRLANHRCNRGAHTSRVTHALPFPLTTDSGGLLALLHRA